MNQPGKRTYGQYCALAVALDVIGERWTLLIIRELLIRPRRYAELLAALPGIGTNLLADRLRFLTEEGIIRSIDPDNRRIGYELTEHGEALQSTVLALARWGLETMAGHASSGDVRPDWAALGVQALIDDARTAAVDDDYLFLVDDEAFTISVRDHHAVAHDGATDAPTLTVKTDAVTLLDIGMRKLDPVAALVGGRLAVSASDPAAMVRCLTLLGLYEGRPDAGEAIS
ncbi:MAG TPA: helix-turn-helix domain-containing protein [Trebonia sp.]|nr:helix-turn-helix domain-containing protein [Trebonia sp.]